MRIVSGYRIQFVQSPARMAEAPPGNHRDVTAAGSQQGTQNQGNQISHSACGVLVDYWALKMKVRPVKDAPRVAHSKSKAHAFLRAQALEVNRHRECRCLSFAEALVGETPDETINFILAQDAAIAFSADNFLGKKVHGTGADAGVSSGKYSREERPCMGSEVNSCDANDSCKGWGGRNREFAGAENNADKDSDGESEKDLNHCSF